jgi:hypothetical protein
LNDVVDLFFGGAVGHVHDHGDDLSICRQKQKPRFLSRLWRNLLSCFLTLLNRSDSSPPPRMEIQGG